MGAEHRFSIGHGRPVLGTESFALPTLDLRQLATAKPLKIGKNQFPVHNYCGVQPHSILHIYTRRHLIFYAHDEPKYMHTTSCPLQKQRLAAEKASCRQKEACCPQETACCLPTQKDLLPARQRRKACFLPANAAAAYNLQPSLHNLGTVASVHARK